MIDYGNTGKIQDLELWLMAYHRLTRWLEELERATERARERARESKREPEREPERESKREQERARES